jgi:AcrR family transcriptional regulator
MGRRDDNKARNRAQLERAALEGFLAHGYAAASIERIAGAAGVARGTFYLYHRDKRTLFTALVDSFLEPVLAATTDARDELACAADLDATFPIYARLGERLVATLLARPAVTRLVLGEARAAGTGGEIVRARIERLEALTAEILADATARGLFRPHDPRAVALAIVGAIERLARAALAGEPGVTPERLPAEIVLLFRRGLAA